MFDREKCRRRALRSVVPFHSQMLACNAIILGMASKKPTPHHTVVSLRVVGGFLGGLELQLADGLNCLIGGRGTGKTTALEFLRFGLGLMPDARTNAQRARALESLVKANL